MTKMVKKWKEPWVEALRSGEFNQGTGALRSRRYAGSSSSGSVYCCLGVLCKVMGMEDEDINGGYLPPKLRKNSNLPLTAVQKKLAEMNDNGNDFKDIADWIEQNL